MSDYPDFGPPSGRPGYGSSYQDKQSVVSDAAEEALVNSISGRGVFLGLVFDIDGPDDVLNYGIRIKIDGNTYFFDNIEDIFLLFSSLCSNVGPRMSYYSPEEGRYCFVFFVTSSFSESVEVYGENGDGVSSTFTGRLYYSLVEES